ncbi:MAG: glycosyltransferase [Propionibacteriaceae bacterium]|nr:glycosyltransferase [Propionibacteriaceae bacterium]
MPKLPAYPVFSLIIPVHDSADFAGRLFDSIPVRDDLEVIVIDDRSTLEQAKDTRAALEARGFPHRQWLPNQQRPGPGGARNTGLDHARGRWIVFADSDDYFTAAFPAALDTYADAPCDMVLFRPGTAPNPAGRSRTADQERIFDAGDVNVVGFNTNTVWGRFARRDLIERGCLRFHETMVSEDVAFAVSCFANARTPVLDAAVIYLKTIREGSLMEHPYTMAEQLTQASAMVEKAAIQRRAAPRDILPTVVPPGRWLLARAWRTHGWRGLSRMAPRVIGRGLYLSREKNLTRVRLALGIRRVWERGRA